MAKTVCWQLFQCSDEACPAHKSQEVDCWLSSGTHCRNGIQGRFHEKMEMCLDCEVLGVNMDPAAMRRTLGELISRMKAYRQIADDREDELEGTGLELAIGLSEVFEALKRVPSGGPRVSLPETSEVELISRLKHELNIAAEKFGEIVSQSHEIAMGLAEHLDVLQRVSKGELEARVLTASNIELLESLRSVTNGMIEGIEKEMTGRRAVEESLRKLEALESSILSVIPHAVIGLRERTIIFANEGVENVFGWKPEELIGKNTRVLYRDVEAYEQIGRNFYPFLERWRTHREEFPCRHKDGRDIFCMVSAAVIGERLEEKGIVVVYEDITERRKIAEALRESERKYLDLYRNAPDAYHSLAPDGTILETNNTWLKMMGFQRDEVVGRMRLTDILAAEDTQSFKKNFSRLQETGAIENVACSLKRKDGTALPVLINATAVYDEEGSFLRARTIIRDNSESKSYERKLRLAAEEWRATFDILPYGVLLLDADLNILRANKYVSELYHVSFRDMVGRKCGDLNFGDDGTQEFCNMLKENDNALPHTFEYFDKNLNKFFVLHESPVFEGGIVKAFVMSLIDISELKNKEKELIEGKDAFFNMLKDLDASYKEVKGLHESLIYSFINAIDAKSSWTKGHSERVTCYAMSIGKEMGLNHSDMEALRIAALLHDVGKIGTYDVVLEKPGKLTKEEFALIRMHPVRGEEILKPIKQFKELLPIIRHHHERMDGKGYPDGLKNGEIPFLSKIITIADSYDSMTSDRPYRPSPPREYALSELRRCSGSQFDPEAVQAFMSFLTKSGKEISSTRCDVCHLNNPSFSC